MKCSMRAVWFCHVLIKASPHTHFGDAVFDGRIRRYDEELHGVLESRTYWEGVLSALKDRATGIDRPGQTKS
jgi:hypothetical protein